MAAVYGASRCGAPRLVFLLQKIRCFSTGQRFLQTEKDVEGSETPTQAAPTQETVGFIGLGNMGAFMATNLINKGYKLVVNDVFPESMADLKELGAETVKTPAEVAERAQKIVTMLPSSPEVKTVYVGDHGLLGAVQDGTLMIDSSTIDPSVAKEIASVSEGKGAIYMDAPVSGGIIAARDGTLTFMVGGKEENFKTAEDLLQHMAKNVVHCGEIGTGQAAKICNNMLLAISMIGTAEAMNLGTRLGLDSKMLAKILNMSTGRCWSSELYNPCPGVVEGVPSSNNYQGGFGTQLMSKDLGLAQNAATATRTATPLGSIAHQIYRMMCNKGYGAMDFSSIYKFLRDDK